MVEFDQQSFNQASNTLKRLIEKFTYDGSIDPDPDEIQKYQEYAKQEDEAAIEILKTVPVEGILNGYKKRFGTSNVNDFDEEFAERSQYLKQWLFELEEHKEALFPPKILVEKDKSKDDNNLPRIVLVTVNDIETKAVQDIFAAETGVKAEPITKDSRVYLYLGPINGVKIYQAVSGMGSGGLGGALQTVEKAIKAIKPQAIIAVGIAFGINEKKQNIGDILVSSQLQLYDPQRIGTYSILSKLGINLIVSVLEILGLNYKGIILRGDKPSASPSLENFFKIFSQSAWKKAKVTFGLILSGEKLIDNVDYRNQLRKLVPECIGGEMEGAGLYVSSQDNKVDWIVIKSICDWADGKKGVDKTMRQTKAATNAASFVLEALKYAKLPISGLDSEEYKQNQFSALESIEAALRNTINTHPLGSYIRHYQNAKSTTQDNRKIDFQRVSWSKKNCADLEDIERFSEVLSSKINETIYNALFENVDVNGTQTTSTSDGVFAVDATGGFVEEKLDELLKNFEDFSDVISKDVCIGVARSELEDLKIVAEVSKPLNSFEFENGVVKYYQGARFINLPKMTFKEEFGRRTCFALGKGGVQLNWYLEEDQEEVICHIGAVRINGSYVQKLYTTPSY